jgi:hypothetical protein
MKKVDLYQTFVTEAEVNELLLLAQEKRILQKVVHLDWCNYFDSDMLELWMAERVHFGYLLDTIQVSFPHIKGIEAGSLFLYSAMRR